MARTETDTHLCDESLCEAIIAMFKVETVVDIGCGNGSYVRKFIEAGFDCVGYDGSPLTEEISGGMCHIIDFSEAIDIGKYDLVVSLEVGEHIPKQYEEVYLDNIIRAARRNIVLSWAIEGQPGYGHVNCRNNDYVIEEIEKRGFIFDKEGSLYLRDKSTLPWFKNTIIIFKNGT